VVSAPITDSGKCVLQNLQTAITIFILLAHEYLCIVPELLSDLHFVFSSDNMKICFHYNSYFLSRARCCCENLKYVFKIHRCIFVFQIQLYFVFVFKIYFNCILNIIVKVQNTL